MIVVKVGGSLYPLGDLQDRLMCFLTGLADPNWLIVPGGGGCADAIRALDRAHCLGAVRSHWLALRACSLNAHFLQAILCDVPIADRPWECAGPGILDAHAFARADEGRPGYLPSSWDATSDSLAARVAEVAGVPLILLKSVTIPPGIDWEEAARCGLVDPLFPQIVRRGRLSVRAVNLREG